MSVKLLHGDCREVLATLVDASVQCCVTSPPYWGLRDYGTAQWDGGDAGCDHLSPPLGGTGRETIVGTMACEYHRNRCNGTFGEVGDGRALEGIRLREAVTAGS